MVDELRHKLDDVKAEVDYSAVEAQYRKYKKNRGKKSLTERKEDYKVALLRNTISDLGYFHCGPRLDQQRSNH